MKTIELSKFKKTFAGKSFGGFGADTQAFVMAFVYSNKGNFVVKGMDKEVRDYVETHFPQSIFNFVWYKNGKSRNMWLSPKKLLLYIENIRCGKRSKYKIILFDQNKKQKTIGVFRKVPHKWLPEYNEAKLDY
ncbi:MAG: hypothetical protein ACOC5T_05000 [Elusimicrobiota bacterium]